MRRFRSINRSQNAQSIGPDSTPVDAEVTRLRNGRGSENLPSEFLGVNLLDIALIEVNASSCPRQLFPGMVRGRITGQSVNVEERKAKSGPRFLRRGEGRNNGVTLR